MDRETAIKLAKDYAKKIIEEEIKPHDGAKLILEKVIYQTDDCPELNYISGLEDEYLEFTKEYRLEFYGKDKIQELLQQTEIQIIEEAKSILKLKI